jgi:hypothetical protein
MQAKDEGRRKKANVRDEAQHARQRGDDKVGKL